MALTPGTRLGPYEIVSALGAGGMGEVYKARDTRLDRTVAIKVLPEHVASDPELKQRFEREAKTISSLNHPHICTLHDVGNQDGVDFLVMEHLEGETLAQRLTKGALPLDQALQTAIQIADALDKAQHQGITHRDLKPGNIMLTKSGAKLLDFGLAKLRPAGAPGAVGLSDAPTVSSPLTGAGSILGTVQYMAPEQLEGQEADARTDIFAFGAVVYEMVTGKKAFEGKSQASLISAIMSSEPAPISNLQAMSPPVLDRIVKKCLAKAPDNRWHSAHDLHDELQWIADAGQEPPSGTAVGMRRMVAIAIVAGLVLIVATLWMLRTSSEVNVASSGSPVVILMDTPAPAGVYDPDTRRNSGTNADDLNDALRDFPVELHKETVSTTWDREDQILRQRPALVLIHRSSFAHSMNLEFGFDDPEPGQEDLAAVLYQIADGKLMAFLGYVGLGNPATRFVVYTRGFGQESQRVAWVSEIEGRFPTLTGRVTALHIPGGDESATFRDPQTVQLIRDLVRGLLDLGTED